MLVGVGRSQYRLLQVMTVLSPCSWGWAADAIDVVIVA